MDAMCGVLSAIKILTKAGGLVKMFIYIIKKRLSENQYPFLALKRAVGRWKTVARKTVNSFRELRAEGENCVGFAGATVILPDVYNTRWGPFCEKGAKQSGNTDLSVPVSSVWENQGFFAFWDFHGKNRVNYIF